MNISYLRHRKCHFQFQRCQQHRNLRRLFIRIRGIFGIKFGLKLKFDLATTYVWHIPFESIYPLCPIHTLKCRESMHVCDVTLENEGPLIFEEYP